MNRKNNSREFFIPALVLTFSIISNTTWAWWQPSGQQRFDIQLTGELNLDPEANIYDVDLFDTPIETISEMKANGKKVICYFSAGSFEDWREDAYKFPTSVIGNSNGWDGEAWLDIRQISILRPIMAARIKLASQKGCDAIDPDNVDGFTNDSGFPLTSSQQIKYNKMLATLAHNRGLAIGLKNDLLQISKLVDSFDFAINESCFDYDECDYLQPFLDVNKPVLAIQYDSTTDLCPQANAMGMSLLLKDHLLSEPGISCLDY